MNETEISIIEYVLILSKIHNEKRGADEEEIEKMKIISLQLDKKPDEILSGFYQIYKKRYVKKD